MPSRAAEELLAELRRHVASERVLEAMARVPRERFVGPDLAGQAYDNVALPIGAGQTISQPLVVARMLEVLALEPTHRVLDIGTGSGYHAALLSLLADHVYTVERHAGLADRARATLAELGIDNVSFRVGDGWEGWVQEAPFDAVNVAAAIGDGLPDALEDQLADGGRMVAPFGGAEQHLVLIERAGERVSRRQLEAVQFVPLVRGTRA